MVLNNDANITLEQQIRENSIDIKAEIRVTIDDAIYDLQDKFTEKYKKETEKQQDSTEELKRMLAMLPIDMKVIKDALDKKSNIVDDNINLDIKRNKNKVVVKNKKASKITGPTRTSSRLPVVKRLSIGSNMSIEQDKDKMESEENEFEVKYKNEEDTRNNTEETTHDSNVE
jgi:predicted P-loop ATPase/GTPase